MITNTSIKIDAKNHLANRWGKAALITFCYSLIQYIMNFIEGHTGNIPILNLAIPIAQFVISIPLSYGLLISFMRLKRGEMVNAFDFLSSGFSFFARAWQVTFSMLGKLIVPVILSIISIILFFTGIVSSSDGILRQSASAKSSSTFYETLEKAQFDLIDAQFNYNQDPTPNNYDTLQRAQETVDSIKENADIDNPTTANTTSSSSNSKHLILGAISLLASSIYFYAKHLSYVLSYQIAYETSGGKKPNLNAWKSRKLLCFNTFFYRLGYFMCLYLWYRIFLANPLYASKFHLFL